MKKKSIPTTIDPLRKRIAKAEVASKPRRGVMPGPYPSSFVRADGTLDRARQIYLPYELDRKLSTFCHERDITVSAYLAEILREALSKT